MKTTEAKMKAAFDCMMGGNNVIQLNRKGKQEVEKVIKGASKDVWRIHAVHVTDSLTICSDKHMIFESSPIDWFKL